MIFTVRKDAPTHIFDKHWQFGMGFDHAAQLLRKDCCDHLKRVHDHLGIRSVRFHGIFCDDMKTIQTFRDVMGLPGTEGFRELSFRRCGQVYDNVLDCGMKPFVELSFMPSALARAEADPHVLYGANTNMPRDLGEWAEYIKAFIRYLLNRYGEEEVAQWYFEVWNEPDLYHPFFKGTQADYFELYKATALAIKEVCPALRVGGPSTSASHWIGDFVGYCRENDLPLDFVSTHQYAGDAFIGVDSGKEDEEPNALTFLNQPKAEPLAGFAPGTPFIDILREIFKDPTADGNTDQDIFPKSAAIARRQADGLPLFYDEWNLSASFSSYYNDTRKQAAYVVRTALNLEGLTEGTCVWCVSDVYEELHQFNEEFHGGLGLISQGGIEKPTFYAMKMLAEAGDTRMDVEAAGEGTVEAAAFESETESQVLLFRQSMKHEEGAAKEAATVRVELEHPPKSVILQRIDESHCNPLKLWEDMGRPADMTRQALADLRADSAMVDETPVTAWHDGVLTFEACLGINDIYFLRIVR